MAHEGCTGTSPKGHEPARYRELIDDLDDHRQELADAAVARIAPFLPYGSEMSLRFAFIPGCLKGDWRTLTTSGSSVLRIGAGWEEVVQRISDGMFHHYLMQLGGGRYGNDRQSLLDVAGFTDERLEITHDLVVSTVLEGVVDYSLDAQCATDARLLKIESATLKELMDSDLVLGDTIQTQISRIYFHRYVDTMKKLQSIVLGLPLEPVQPEAVKVAARA